MELVVQEVCWWWEVGSDLGKIKGGQPNLHVWPRGRARMEAGRVKLRGRQRRAPSPTQGLDARRKARWTIWAVGLPGLADGN